MNKTLMKINEKSKQYELGLKEDYKKKNGIFYTNSELALKMLDELNLPLESSVIDPCCGIGAFLYVAKCKGYNNLFGCDIDEGAIKIAKGTFNINNVKKYDTLTNEYDKIINIVGHDGKFDCVIGNPPYAIIDDNNLCRNVSNDKLKMVKESGNNLFVAALFQSLDLVKDGGVVSYIIPKSFLHVTSYQKIRLEILCNTTIIEIIDIGSYFQNVRGEQIILTFKKEKCKTGHKIVLKKMIKNEFKTMCLIPQLFYKNEILMFNSYQDFMIYKKLSKINKKLADFRNVKIHRGHSTLSSAIRGKDIRKFGLKDKELPNEGNQLFMQNIYSAESGSIATFGGNLDAGQTVTILSMNSIENCKLYLGILLSKLCNLFLYKYCYNSSKLTMHTDSKYLMKLPIPDSVITGKYYRDIINIVEKIEAEEYMSYRWLELTHELDNIINQAYGMSKYEVMYMDIEMNKIRSSRWQ